MVLQVTSNVGGTTASVPVDSVTPPPAAVITPASVPQYRMDFAGLTRASSVGLSTPTAVGDFEIAFSRIAADLKDALNVLGDLNKVGLSQSRRAELSAAFAAFAHMADWGALVDANAANIVKQDKIINEESLRRATAEQSKGILEGQRDAKLGQIRQNNTDISTYQGYITGLNTEDSNLIAERARLDPKKDGKRISEIDQRRAQIPSDIAFWNLQIGNKLLSNQSLSSDVTALNTQISGLQGTIDDAKQKVSTATTSKTESQRIVRDTPPLMEAFYLSTITLMKVLAGKVASDTAGDTFATQADGGQFDRLISALASALVNISSVLTAFEVDRDVAMGGVSGTGLNLDQSAPGRFGQPNATVARALAFAGIVAGVLGAVSDLLNALKNGLGMQTAEGFANAGASRVRVGV